MTWERVKTGEIKRKLGRPDEMVVSGAVQRSNCTKRKKRRNESVFKAVTRPGGYS